MHRALHRTIEQLLPGVASVSPERRALLDALAAHVLERRRVAAPARLVFICTHNSRRSHMAQLWAAAAAAWHGLDGVETYSGGTEATAFNPRAVAAMQRAGFEIAAAGPRDNPRCEVSLGPQGPRMLAWSKIWSDAANPSEAFAAVMTCSQADADCPLVSGASTRIALPFEDPKAADGTPEEPAVYDARAREIAVEMLYLFGVVASAERDAPANSC